MFWIPFQRVINFVILIAKYFVKMNLTSFLFVFQCNNEARRNNKNQDGSKLLSFFKWESSKPKPWTSEFSKLMTLPVKHDENLHPWWRYWSLTCEDFWTIQTKSLLQHSTEEFLLQVFKILSSKIGYMFSNKEKSFIGHSWIIFM